MSYNERGSQVMLKKAEEKWLSANDDFNAGRYDSCISNLYYSAFQTVTALLIIRGDAINKHTHVRGYVNKELAQKGLINKELVKLYNKLMEYRSDADYNTELFFDKETAEKFVNGNMILTKKLNASLWNSILNKMDYKHLHKTRILYICM